MKSLLICRQKRGSADLLAKLFQLYPALQEWERNLLIGAGVEFVGREYVIQPNDDIAVMPPVQGG